MWVMAVVGGSWRLCVSDGGCGWVVCGSWRLCRGSWWVMVVVWGVMVVVCGTWWLWVGHGGCVGVMVCESWCVSQKRYLRMLSYVKYQRLQTSKANLGMVHSQEDIRLFHRH